MLPWQNFAAVQCRCCAFLLSPELYFEKRRKRLSTVDAAMQILEAIANILLQISILNFEADSSGLASKAALPQVLNNPRRRS